jgi:hypothetical protein
MFSPSQTAEPMEEPSSAIDFEGIDNPHALKALLRAREEKMQTLEKRIQIAQGAKNKLKERYSEKIEVLESLVIALRRKLQTAIENGDVEEKSASSSIDAESAKPNAARGGNGDVVVMAQLQEKVQQLTAALQARTKECKAQALLLEQKEAKTIELQNAIVQAQNKSPEASGLSRKVQILNSELEEARNAGKK